MSRTTIPTLEACPWDVPPVPATVIVFHPEADDCFNVSGIGATRELAYIAMLEDLYNTCVDRLETDEEEALFTEAIRQAQEAARP
jgi:hypothetical protein